MKKTILLALTIITALVGFKINISADTTTIGIEVINDGVNYTNDTYLSPIDYNDFDTLYTDQLSTNRIFWITSTNRPKITIDTTDSDLRYAYKGLYVRIYDNDIADIVDYYFSFDSITYDTRYQNNDEIYISLDYGEIGEITIFINEYTLIYPINDFNDNVYGVSIALHRKTSTDEYYSGYDDGLEDGLKDGKAEGYINGYIDARDIYGFYDANTGTWIDSDARYLEGFYEGQTSGSEAFSVFGAIFSVLATVISSVFTIEILPNFYSGYIVGFSIILGMMALFFTIKGKK